MKNTKQLFGILILTFGALFHVQAQDPFTNGLVAYYPFDGNANDASGNGNNGSIVGSDWNFLGDRFGYTNSLWLNTTSTPAWNLDGAYVTAPRSVALDFNNDFTLSVWVNLPSAMTNHLPENLISNGNDAGSLNLRMVANDSNFGGQDYLQFIWGDVNHVPYAVFAPVREKWFQVTVVRSGTNVSLFKNGSFLTNSLMTATANTSTIWLGRHATGGGNSSYYPLVGGIDDVRMYNRALSLAEVQHLYQAETGGHTDIAKAVRLDFTQLLTGWNYQVQFSHDLTNWTNSGSAFTATSSTNSQYMDVTDWNTFWRLKVAP